MRDFVETCLDVSLDDPLIRAGREVAYLGYRVMSPAPGAEPVGAREEIRLEDRLQHQLQGRLDHPVPHSRDPQAALLAVRLGNHALPHGQRTEAPVLHLRPQLQEEILHAPHRLDVEGRPAVHACRARALVTPHPSPADQEEGGIGSEIEQVIKPAMRIIAGPTVQLGLDLQYPALRQIQSVLKLRITGIHRRGSWHSSILPADSLAPFATGVRLRAGWPA